MPSKKYAVIGKNCVACGCCVKVCPLVDDSVCVGCGKCAAECPAGVIEIVLREGQEK